MAKNKEATTIDLTALVADAEAGKGKQKDATAEDAEHTRITLFCSWDDKTLVETLAKNAGKSQQQVQASIFAAGCEAIRNLQAAKK